MEYASTLLRLPAVLARIGYKRSRLYDLVKNGQFPKPKLLPGGRAVAWLSSDVDAWIDAVAAGRGGE